MKKGYWREGGKDMRLQHHLLVGKMSYNELADLFGVDSGNLSRAIKTLKLVTKPFPPSFTRKERHIGLQCVKRGLLLPTHPKTPRHCKYCGKRLTYNIYGEEDNNATVYLTDWPDSYTVACRKCSL